MAGERSKIFESSGSSFPADRFLGSEYRSFIEDEDGDTFVHCEYTSDSDKILV